MTVERDRDQQDNQSPKPKLASERFDDALRDAAAAEEEISCDDADVSGFLERFPVAARAAQRPKDGG